MAASRYRSNVLNLRTDPTTFLSPWRLALLGVAQARNRSALDRLATLIDWAPVELRLTDIYEAAKGEPAWPPPLAPFKALLIAVWHDDVIKHEQAGRLTLVRQ